MSKVEEKLFNNRYLVDEGRPHVRIRKIAAPSPQLLSLVSICPAGCYALDETEGGSNEVTVSPEGCLECGTCRIVCAETNELEWNYPRGGYGILFKFG